MNEKEMIFKSHLSQIGKSPKMQLKSKNPFQLRTPTMGLRSTLLLLACLCASSVFAQLPPKVNLPKWQSLFNGKDLRGWKKIGDESWTVVDGAIYGEGVTKEYGYLATEIEIPIQEKWIEREPALRGFAGRSLKIPIYGTFQKPRIVERAVADLSKQLLQGAAKQALGDELNRQFEKLFGR